MKNINTINKIFLLVCAAMILFIVLTVPHESSNVKAEKEIKTGLKN